MQRNWTLFRRYGESGLFSLHYYFVFFCGDRGFFSPLRRYRACSSLQVWRVFSVCSRQGTPSEQGPCQMSPTYLQINLCRRVLYVHKRALNIRKRALHIRKQFLHILFLCSGCSTPLEQGQRQIRPLSHLSTLSLPTYHVWKRSLHICKRALYLRHRSISFQHWCLRYTSSHPYISPDILCL